MRLLASQGRNTAGQSTAIMACRKCAQLWVAGMHGPCSQTHKRSGVILKEQTKRCRRAVGTVHRLRTYRTTALLPLRAMRGCMVNGGLACAAALRAFGHVHSRHASQAAEAGMDSRCITGLGRAFAEAARQGPKRGPAFLITRPSQSLYLRRVTNSTFMPRRAIGGAIRKLTTVGTKNTAPQKVYLHPCNCSQPPLPQHLQPQAARRLCSSQRSLAHMHAHTAAGVWLQ